MGDIIYGRVLRQVRIPVYSRRHLNIFYGDADDDDDDEDDDDDDVHGWSCGQVFSLLMNECNCDDYKNDDFDMTDDEQGKNGNE